MAEGGRSTTDEERTARHAVVHGHVQGVFFRASAVEAATSHGVGGWVRNRDDGTVEMVLEGTPAAVDAMLAWAREGPPHAAVTDVAVSGREPEGHEGFAQR